MAASVYWTVLLCARHVLSTLHPWHRSSPTAALIRSWYGRWHSRMRCRAHGDTGPPSWPHHLQKRRRQESPGPGLQRTPEEPKSYGWPSARSYKLDSSMTSRAVLHVLSWVLSGVSSLDSHNKNVVICPHLSERRQSLRRLCDHQGHTAGDRESRFSKPVLLLRSYIWASFWEIPHGFHLISKGVSDHPPKKIFF